MDTTLRIPRRGQLSKWRDQCQASLLYLLPARRRIFNLPKTTMHAISLAVSAVHPQYITHSWCGTPVTNPVQRTSEVEGAVWAMRNAVRTVDR